MLKRRWFGTPRYNCVVINLKKKLTDSKTKNSNIERTGHIAHWVVIVKFYKQPNNNFYAIVKD